MVIIQENFVIRMLISDTLITFLKEDESLYLNRILNTFSRSDLLLRKSVCPRLTLC